LRPDVRRGLSWRGAATALSLVAVAVVSVSSARLVARTVEPPEVPTSRPEHVFVVETDRANESQPAVQWAVRTQDRSEDAIMLAHDGPHDGEDAFERAYELHGEERWDEAAATFLEAAEAGYREDVSLYNAACGHARMGDTGQAISLIERALEAGFDNFELLYEDSDLDPIRRDASFQSMMEQVGEEHRGGGRYEATVDRYDDLVAQGSTDGDAWYEVGTTLLSLRDFERSIDALGRAVENRDAKANALYNSACAYSLKGDTNQALDYLERAVLAGFDSDERFANDSDLDNIRESGRFDEIEELHDTLSLDRFRSSWGNWGSEYSSRRWEPAVEEFTEFVRQNPDVGRGWFNLGWALHHSRRHAEAREAFLKQLQLDYQPRIATYNVACTYAMENQTDAAFEWLERAVDEFQMSAHQLIGDEDLESLHDDPRFEELLERAIENDDDFGLHRKHEKFLFKWHEKLGKEKEKKRENARMY
jgi:tetratricopeptide (TPR) repeat protein